MVAKAWYFCHVPKYCYINDASSNRSQKKNKRFFTCSDLSAFPGASPSKILPTLMKLVSADTSVRKIAAMIGPIRHVWLYHPETVEELLSSNK